MIFEGTKNQFFFLGLTRAGICLPTLENCFALSKYLNVRIEDILVCEDEMFSVFLCRCA